MDKALSQLIRISHAVGKDSLLVQGGGGNTSVKTPDGRYMYIKASGTALKDMSARNGWRRIRLDSVLTIIGDKSIAKLDTYDREIEIVNRLQLACDDDIVGEVRPSVEAHLHAFLDRCVIHLHPVAVLSYACAKKGRAELEKLFAGEKFPCLWVPYTDPGFTLAGRVARLVSEYEKQYGRKPAILIFEKHGLLVSADNPDAALRLVRKVIRRCLSRRGKPRTAKVKRPSEETIAGAKLCLRRAFFEATGRYAAISYYCNDVIAGFWRHKDAQKMLAAAALTPDELLYASGPAMWVDKCDPKRITGRLCRQMEKGGRPSVAFLVKGVGLFAAGTKKMAPTIRDITECSFLARDNAHRMGGIFSLNKRQQNFINEWEAEAFRAKVAGGASAGELKDRIAVVTGAGSGLGRGIAAGLARAGAVVGLVDVDTKAAQATAGLIRKGLPEAQVLVVGCDVTDEADVSRVFAAVLEEWGGLDILVNAAGIAPAGPLVDMPVDKWRAALEVNLTGYFLMGREAARIMIRQGMGGNIINLSSKSGIEASKDNTAYNATKAGEIHIARGWALELGQYGIRVNSVAPGNVFEGSKIWNAEYMKVCARKYGIKPDEVIPYYVSKTALNREIAGRDVADAVVFLCSDKARTITGQILVPDSGQVMVR
ncbi:MAG: SDR family oxidoreductase [Planctomycetota bacterium]|jgi:NAD(P)-dependent dehydrogenase (short-subunit alcohol dehydrogenase family)/rhamnose utilization protein RhaD (predicted bifunctional aldolase and dehydrogenase)